ncbi:hypothetical protein VFPPC_11461 [Pochonia chlamydosporia 170]|uniref:Uncharacterized protein n=1 Tax=Pochonia chlamydosporia 170 TaxID=1380566 RepID=A0A179EX02_METCM|nr:hypothetical protein VFPPC_11461 [Pochonia chlamydosporia 170]OAQ57714.1 hypothetical protein VFPPC_11461 [Pochonia chlamydosporia 170]
MEANMLNTQDPAAQIASPTENSSASSRKLKLKEQAQSIVLSLVSVFRLSRKNINDVDVSSSLSTRPTEEIRDAWKQGSKVYTPRHNTALYSPGKVAYSPYQPFTTCAVVESWLVTPQERKQAHKLARRNMSLELVQDIHDQW